MDDGNRLTVYELVERVIPCIIAKHYSENYIQGFRSTFRNLLAYCNKNEKKYFTAELAQQFMLDCYGVQPGTVERRCSRVHRAMDLLSDYQHFNAVMLRRRLNREFPAGLQEGAVNYLQKLSLHGRRENTLRSHRNVLLRFTDYLFSVGVTDYKLLSADIVNRSTKQILRWIHFFRRLHRIVSGILKQCILLRQAKISFIFVIFWGTNLLRQHRFTQKLIPKPGARH